MTRLARIPIFALAPLLLLSCLQHVSARSPKVATGRAALPVTVAMVDGSRLIGVTETASLAVAPPWGTIDVPSEHLRGIVTDSASTMIRVTLTNGDTITGEPLQPTLNVETRFGTFDLRWADIRSVVFQRTGQVSIPEDLARDLVLHLDFDTAEHLSADSGTTGKIHGTTWAPNGSRAGGRFFDGADDRIEIADLGNPEELTVSAWVRPLSVKHDGYVISRWGDQFVLYVDDWQLDGWRFLARRNNGEALGSPVGKIPSALEAWTHLVGTFSKDGVLTLYINGAAAHRETGSPLPLNRSDLPLIIGSDSTARKTFHGTIDEVAVFSRALTPDEVRLLHDHQNAIVALRSE